MFNSFGSGGRKVGLGTGDIAKKQFKFIGGMTQQEKDIHITHREEIKKIMEPVYAAIKEINEKYPDDRIWLHGENSSMLLSSVTHHSVVVCKRLYGDF